MRLLTWLPEGWRKLAGEAVKFGLIGAANFVINFAIFNALVLTVFPHGQLKANVLATVAATTASYFMNRHWTFKDRARSAIRREYALFFLFNAAGLLIELAVLGLAKYGLGITGLLALNAFKVGGIALGTVFRFWSYRTFVFRLGVTNDEAVAAEALAEVGTVGVDFHRLDELDPAYDGDGLAAELDRELARELEQELAAERDRATASRR